MPRVCGSGARYFLIYALLWVFITVEDFMGEVPFLSAAKEAIESAKSAQDRADAMLA